MTTPIKVSLVNRDEFLAFADYVRASLAAVGAPIDTSGLITQNQAQTLVNAALVTAATDATQKANTAIATAAADASTKATSAQVLADSHTGTAISAHNADMSAHSVLLSDYASKAYVDALGSGISSYPQACDAASTGNIALTGLFAVDGVTVTDGMRVLVWKQTDPLENGVYEATSGAWARSPDFDSDIEIQRGALIFVTGGTTYGGASFVLETPEPQVPGTDALTFRQYTRPDQLSALAPLQRLGNVLSLITGSLTDTYIAAANKDGASNVASMRTLGTSAGQALPGNHASVTNARTPTNHASTHGANGSDPINVSSLGIAATNVAFTPITGVAASTVQAAIGQVQANVVAAAQSTGAGRVNVRAVSGSASVAPGDVLQVDATAGEAVITLFAVGNNQAPATVVKTDATANPVTIQGTGGTINGSATVSILDQDTALTIASGASSYRII